MTTKESPTRRGRGSAAPGVTRDALLTSARDEFARVGYGAATVRAIAAGAGVDPALVMHYFGTKEALFVATLQKAGGVRERIAAAFEGPPDMVPRQLVTAYLDLWEDPETAPTLVSVVRSALTNPVAADAVRHILEVDLIAGAGRRLPPERVNLAGAQLFGVAIARYVLRTDPLATLDRATLTELLADQLGGLLAAPAAR
ncbi:TetR/AcrR family transcriptional regulator [Cellulomonas alba]|uniref:TetR family transcriptional regulator n=1 Tax=Cellulomonas alba TaxID=3053467 RepID=A0ABT7SCI4_9CELL|nr:TetR family transcriptional regulator [Cellulomonas alba]MDM7853898.1 TetR family transcriptional regulator [Cellulomonas alba]